MKTRLVLVDIDGTVSDWSQRLPYLRKTPKDWKSFFAEQDNDPVIAPMRQLLYSLSDFFQIIMWTGRPERYSGITINWLDRNRVPCFNVLFRSNRDFRPNSLVKLSMLHEIRKQYEPVLAIDDDPAVVKLLNDSGLPCLAAMSPVTEWVPFPTPPRPRR